MENTTRLEFRGGMSFEVSLDHLRFVVDAKPENGGNNKGPGPKALLLSALAGCTGMDVVAILGKMQMPYDAFAVEVSGKPAEEHPKVYTDIHVRYIFAGGRLDRLKIEKAVGLSLDKYCGVAAMLKKATKLTHEIVGP